MKNCRTPASHSKTVALQGYGSFSLLSSLMKEHTKRAYQSSIPYIANVILKFLHYKAATLP
ncbi:MAG TPA: hypothetical protein DCX23_04260 [Lachnospiraceae bacterium]|nr:hypothetical protein [Lachnospiraceae bacterium]